MGCGVYVEDISALSHAILSQALAGELRYALAEAHQERAALHDKYVSLGDRLESLIQVRSLALPRIVLPLQRTPDHSPVPTQSELGAQRETDARLQEAFLTRDDALAQRDEAWEMYRQLGKRCGVAQGNSLLDRTGH
jgi:hypothetical protein